MLQHKSNAKSHMIPQERKSSTKNSRGKRRPSRGAQVERKDVGEVSAASIARPKSTSHSRCVAGDMSDSPSTAAVHACVHGYAEVLGGLVSSRAIDPDGADPASGQRYLVVAAQHGQTTCVRGLLQSKASPDTHDSQGDTPLCVAAYWGLADVLDVLLEHGANPNVRTQNGEAALHRAAYTGSAACCRMLLAASADITARDAEGTALEMATRHGHDSCAALLTAAWMPDAPVTLTFENRSPWPLVLCYLLPTPGLPVGQAYTRPPEQRTVRLPSGAKRVCSTFAGHEWYLRSESDGTLLDTYMVRSPGGAQQQHCIFPSLGWEWEDGSPQSGQWRQYDPELLLRLLHAHASGHSMLTVPDPQRGVDYEINLTDRTQRNTRTGFVRRLREVPPPPPPPPSAAVLLAPGAPLAQLRAFPGDLLAPPPYWSQPDSQDGAGSSSSSSPPVVQRLTSWGLQRELRPESPVFQEVLQMLCDSGTDLASLRLSAIYCVENRDFFREYQARRKTMLTRLGLPRLNERWLWHGTDEKSIPLILANGFLRDFNTRGAHGKGVYFARQAAYSLSPSYSKIDPNTGEHCLLLCRVLVGEACEGRSGMERPTQKPNSSALHESMVDRLPVEQSQIVVLSAGSDKQAYPEFVLKFQSRDEGGAFGGRRGGGLFGGGSPFGGVGGNGGGGGGGGGGPGGSVFGNGGPGSAFGFTPAPAATVGGFTFGPSAVQAAGAHAALPFGAASPLATAAPAAPAFGGFADAPAALLAEWEGSKGITLQDETRSKTHAKLQSQLAKMLVRQVVCVHFFVWERAELVLRELASASQTGPEGERAVCATIATQVIDTCATMVDKQPGMAYALSGFVLHVGERCPVLWECLLARLQASCCYCVPYYPENPGNTDEFKKRLGYKQGETKKDFYARMAGYVTLYAALLQQSSIAQFPPQSAGNALFDRTRPDAKMQTRPVQGGFAPKGVSPMARAWAWLARLLNHPPGNITATILLAFLKPCARALSRAYPTQFSKLLSFLQTTYLAKIRGMVAGQGNPAEEEAARVNLVSWLTDTNALLAKGGRVPEPKEADMPEYKPPDDLSDTKGTFD